MRENIETAEVLEKMEEVKNNLTQLVSLRAEMASKINSSVLDIEDSQLEISKFAHRINTEMIPKMDELLSNLSIKIATVNTLLQAWSNIYTDIADCKWEHLVETDVDLSTNLNLLSTLAQQFWQLKEQVASVENYQYYIAYHLKSISEKIDTKYEN